MAAARRFGRCALFVLLAAACGIPRPRFTDIRSTVAPEGAIVFVAIDPNGTTVSEAHLEWGRRPSLENPATITFEDDVPRTFVTLPLAEPFTTSWHFQTGQPPELVDGEIVDFQVRLVHSTPNGGTVSFWSDRHHFVVEGPGQDLPPATPAPWTLDPATCSDTTVLVGPRPVARDIGTSNAVISADGRFVAFTTITPFDPQDLNDATDVYLADLTTGTVQRVSAFAAGIDTGGSQPAISHDGGFVAFVSETMFDAAAAPGVNQVYLWDRTTGSVVTRVSDNRGFDMDSGGRAPSISQDGRFVAFVSRARFSADPQANIDVPQVYLWERNTGNVTASTVTARVTAQGGTDTDRGGHAPAVSGDGAFVTFVSRTRFPIDLQADTNVDQVYLWERGAGAVVARVSAQGGTDTDRGGHAPSISHDGRFVAFVSATRFAVDEQADVEDDQIYLWDRASSGGRVVARITDNGGVDVDRGGSDPSLSADGRWVAFVSRSRFPAFETFNPDYDQVYLWDRSVGGVVAWISASSHDVDRGGFDPSVSGDGRLTAFSSLTNFDANFDLNGMVDAYVRCP